MKQKENKSVIAVIVTYNRKTLLKESIEALLNQKYKNIKVLVIDNASTDGTQEYITDLVDNTKVIYLNTGKNLGGAGGFNYGIKQAVIMGCDYIWIMDDDCVVRENSLTSLVDFAKEKNDDFGFLSSVVKWTDDSICKMNVQRYSMSKKIENFEENQKIEMASFVSMFFKSSVVEDIGLPIKDFFIWGDDWEYTYRISRKYDCYLVANSIVTHKMVNNDAVNIATDSPERLPRYFYDYRNEGYLYKKAGFKGKIYFLLKRLLHIKRIVFSKTKNKKERLKILFKGSRAVRKFKPHIEYVYNEKTPIKVLEFFGEPLAYGGQEAFMLNMYKNFTKENIKYVFCTPFDLTNKNLIELSEKRKDKIVHYDYNFNSKLRKVYIKKALKRILKSEKFEAIHIHTGSTFTIITAAKLAKRYGVKNVIAHSHATGKKNFKYRLIKKYSDKRIKKCVNYYLACSKIAAEWRFPKEVLETEKCIVVNNGISTKDYKFDSKTREEYRKELNIKDKTKCICHVGRFGPEKNHNFIVEIAKILNDKKIDFKFILVGEGQLKQEILEKIKTLNLSEKFIVLEKRSDISKLMMASDVFILPSLFEGLGIVAIESQATGLPTICSNGVPEEADLSDIVCHMPIESAEDWVEAILQTKENKNREIYSQKIAEAKYDSKDSAELLEKIYVGYLMK